MTFIKQELAAICVIVYGALEIPWDMTVKGTALLVEEILARLEAEEKPLIAPYANGLVKVFSEQ